MEVESKTAGDILNLSLGERQEELRGFHKPKKPRGKKIKLPAGKSFTALPDSSDDSEDEEEEMNFNGNEDMDW